MKKIKICSTLFLFACLIFLLSACGCEHQWTDATCKTPKTCSLCGMTEGETIAHDFTNATCTSPKTCYLCGLSEGDSLGHNYLDGYCVRCCEKDPSFKDLNDFNFCNTYGMNTWLSIVEYNFTDGYVKLSEDKSLLMQIFDEYLNRDFIDSDEYYDVLTHMNPTVRSLPISSKTDDVLTYSGSDGTGPWIITDKAVDPENKYLIIKTRDATWYHNRTYWYVTIDMLDLSTLSQCDDGKFIIYFK